MKVAIVTTRHGAQDDRIYFKQALSLAKLMEVTIIAPDDGEVLIWPDNVRYHPIRRRRSVFGRLRSLMEAINVVRRETPDFCHLHDLDLVLTIPFIRLLTNTKIVYDSHEVFTRDDLLMSSHHLPRWAARCFAGLIAQVERVLLATSHHVITAVDPVGGALGSIRTPIRTIFNYPRLSIFETDPEDLRKAVAEYQGRLPIIYQGVMARNRGLYHMLEALPLIVEKEPRVVLRLVGMQDKDLRSTIEQLVADLRLQSNVEISGWIPHEEIPLMLKSSLIGLLPFQPCKKHQKALPIKVLEYMACGLPVVSANLDLVGSYVSQSGAGLLYDSTRPQELARCVLELLNDTKLMARMSEAGLRAVQERWNWGAMEDELFGVYESVGSKKFEDLT